MAAVTTTAQDLIVGALRNINALEAGEVGNTNDLNDALQVLNDMLDGWSLDHLTVFCSVENILTLSSGKGQYTVGNYTGGTFGGTLTSSSNVITNVIVPAALKVGADITDLSASLPAGTTVTAIGTNTVTLSANAVLSVTLDTFTYTVPGDFKIPRPLRITNAFTRITPTGSPLDYQIEPISRDKWARIGYKSLPGPWPQVLYYDPTYPLGTLYFYQQPSQTSELHLWTDTVLSNFANLTTAISLPQGFARAIKKNLAVELAPEYGKAVGPQLIAQARQSLQMIRDLNARPQAESLYDADMVRARKVDAGWILSGGFT